MAGRLYAPPGWGRQEQESWRAWTSPDTEAAGRSRRAFPYGIRQLPRASGQTERAQGASLCLSDDQTISDIPFFSHRGAVDATALELTRNIYHVSAAVKWKAADA